VGDPRLGERRLRIIGVTYAVNMDGQSETAGGAEQKLVKLGGALVVTPVADPDEIPFRLALERAKEARVCGLVPRPDAAAPAEGGPGVAQHLPEGEDPVIAAEVEGRHLPRRGDDAVVRVVEQEAVVI